MSCLSYFSSRVIQYFGKNNTNKCYLWLTIQGYSPSWQEGEGHLYILDTCMKFSKNKMFLNIHLLPLNISTGLCSITNLTKLRHTSYDIWKHLWNTIFPASFPMPSLSLTSLQAPSTTHQKQAHFFPHSWCSFTLNMCHFVSYIPSVHIVFHHPDTLPLPQSGRCPCLFHKPTLQCI